MKLKCTVKQPVAKCSSGSRGVLDFALNFVAIIFDIASLQFAF